MMPRITCIHAMPKNPFLTIPAPNQSPWTQKQENPFLRNSGNNMFSGPGTGTGTGTSISGAGIVISGAGTRISISRADAPIRLDEETFPSLLPPSADCNKKQAGGLNFKLAVSTGIGIASTASTASIASTASTASTDSTASIASIASTASVASVASVAFIASTGRNSRNMFLCPQPNANAHDAYANDAHAHDDADAYDSAYTKYYNDGR